MPPHLSSRALLQATAPTAAAPTLSPTATGRATAATLSAPLAWTVRPFQHGDLSPGKASAPPSASRPTHPS
ncbi:hypothetical protein ABZ614_07700 [Streptomyces sp. NPDC013178]|uniref:hypothetical protein n=1 Tax=Streptomyces sp. NPDC013178 TaxID=3155118 RepID=UPI0033C0ABBC